MCNDLPYEFIIQGDSMKKRKRVVALGLLLCMVLSLSACNGASGDLKLKGMKQSATKQLIPDDSVRYSFADTVYTNEGYQTEKVVTALSEFSLRLFEKNLWEVGYGSDNVLISPASVITALGMTSFGAKGDTLSQMEYLFGVSRGYLNYHNAMLLNENSEELKLANSIWFTNDGRITVKDEFLHFNKENYGADIYETAFNEATLLSINDWVEKRTNGMIKNVLDEIPADAVMYLINALTFEAEWAEKYESTQIWQDATFTTSLGNEQKVDMMQSQEGWYLSDEKATGFLKYYKGQKYAFVALLPEEGLSVDDYVRGLSGYELQQILANKKQAVVMVDLPQFSYEYDVEMSQMLQEMGMTDAFNGAKADFTNMATSTDGNVFMSRVIHKTFIEVSPVGTKAGAATVVEMECESAPVIDKFQTVSLDRPFLYMIIDCENNQPIFMGAVNSIQPEEAEDMGIRIGSKSPYDTVNDSDVASMELVSISKEDKKLTVEYSYSGENELDAGEFHAIEVWKEDGWYSLKLPSNYAFNQVAYPVLKGENRQLTYGWAGYGDLPEGKYRMVTSVMDVEKGLVSNHITTYYLAVEFEIE